MSKCNLASYQAVPVFTRGHDTRKCGGDTVVCLFLPPSVFFFFLSFFLVNDLKSPHKQNRESGRH